MTLTFRHLRCAFVLLCLVGPLVTSLAGCGPKKMPQTPPDSIIGLSTSNAEIGNGLQTIDGHLESAQRKLKQ